MNLRPPTILEGLHISRIQKLAVSRLAQNIERELPRKYQRKFLLLIAMVYSRGVRDAISRPRFYENSPQHRSDLRYWDPSGADTNNVRKAVENELLSIAAVCESTDMFLKYYGEELPPVEKERRTPGRPRLDLRAKKIEELKRQKKSWAQISRQLSKESGSHISEDACRQLYRNLRKRSSPKG
jgi:hypothetical protein